MVALKSIMHNVIWSDEGIRGHRFVTSVRNVKGFAVHTGYGIPSSSERGRYQPLLMRKGVLMNEKSLYVPDVSLIAQTTDLSCDYTVERSPVHFGQYLKQVHRYSSAPHP